MILDTRGDRESPITCQDHLRQDAKEHLANLYKEDEHGDMVAQENLLIHIPNLIDDEANTTMSSKVT